MVYLNHTSMIYFLCRLGKALGKQCTYCVGQQSMKVETLNVYIRFPHMYMMIEKNNIKIEVYYLGSSKMNQGP